MLDDSIRITDPGRWQAAHHRVFLVKTYYDDLGCVEDKVFNTSTEALEYIRVSARKRGPHLAGDYDYRYYSPDGEYIPIEINWVPKVRCV